MIEFQRERELSIKREHDTFSINTSINRLASQRDFSLNKYGDDYYRVHTTMIEFRRETEKSQ